MPEMSLLAAPAVSQTWLQEAARGNCLRSHACPARLPCLHLMQAQTKPVTAEEKPLLFRTDANSMRYASIPIKEERNKVP